jgi:hypothetical protein
VLAAADANVCYFQPLTHDVAHLGITCSR